MPELGRELERKKAYPKASFLLGPVEQDHVMDPQLLDLTDGVLSAIATGLKPIDPMRDASGVMVLLRGAEVKTSSRGALRCSLTHRAPREPGTMSVLEMPYSS